MGTNTRTVCVPTYALATLPIASAEAEEKALGAGYPNYEYGQSAVATFKRLMTGAQPDIQFVTEQATPLGNVDAAPC